MPPSVLALAGILKVYQEGDVLRLKVFRKEETPAAELLSGEEKLVLFCECVLDENADMDNYVVRVVDSSRYFVLKLDQRNEEGAVVRTAYIGIGFRDRNDALDLYTHCVEFSNFLRRQQIATGKLKPSDLNPSSDLFACDTLEEDEESEGSSQGNDNDASSTTSSLSSPFAPLSTAPLESHVKLTLGHAQEGEAHSRRKRTGLSLHSPPPPAPRSEEREPEQQEQEDEDWGDFQGA